MLVLLGFTFAPQGGHIRMRSKLLVCTWNQLCFRRHCCCYFICSATLLHLLVTFYLCYIIYHHLFNEIVFSFSPFLSLSSLILKRNLSGIILPLQASSLSLFFPSKRYTFFGKKNFHSLPLSISPSDT